MTPNEQNDQPALIAYPFPVGARVKGPHVQGVVERHRGPYSIEVRQDRDKRIMITPILGIELEPSAA